MYSNTNSNSILSQQHRETHTQDTIINIIEPEIQLRLTLKVSLPHPPYQSPYFGWYFFLFIGNKFRLIDSS